MRFWRLSTAPYAEAFDGGYGLHYDGRWNAVGDPVTYCATVPSLCVLEKLVHTESIDDLPEDLQMIEYEAPDALLVEIWESDDLPPDWRRNGLDTRDRGSNWLRGATAPLLRVPSVVVAEPGALDRNILINHRHPEHKRIVVRDIRPFEIDPRLL
ncbi:MAG: RES family NAD+ phosphorylase [Alphaproteobacteria bacterium]